MKTKICTKCKKEKFLSDFNKDKKSKDKLSCQCKKCLNAYNRLYYRKNIDKKRKYDKGRRQENKQWFVNYKKTLKCENCPEDRYYCLVFHHRNPEEKKRGIADMVRTRFSKETILKETAKCQVLCANCHRELHWKEAQ